MTIRSFKDADTEAIFDDQPVVRFQAIQQAARRKLLVLDAATDLRVLAINRGNHLEALKKIGQVNTASGSTTNGGSVSCGKKETHSM